MLLFQQGDFFGCAMVISLLQSVFVNAGLLVCYDVVLEVFFYFAESCPQFEWLTGEPRRRTRSQWQTPKAVMCLCILMARLCVRSTPKSSVGLYAQF